MRNGQSVPESVKQKMRSSALRRIEEKPWTIPKFKRFGISPTNYKGEKASYSAHHHWVKYHLGKASKCENCNTTGGRYEWANISGEYLRDTSDWAELCIRCHRLIDNVVNKSWNTRKAMNI